MSDRKRVVIGFLGMTLDSGKTEGRWNRWRPTVSLCQQPDLPIDRIELLVDERATIMAERIAGDVTEVSPHTEIRQHVISLSDSWDFSEVYQALRDFSDRYNFNPEVEDYLVNITTGTHVAQICWFMLTETGHIPGKILQQSPPRGRNEDGVYDPRGTYRIIDLDLSRYDAINTRFDAERELATDFLKSGIATRNPAFNAMIDQIEKVAIRSRAPVLLSGPTGAGKSQLAKRIYELKKSQRQVSGDFVEVNCATLRGDQAMSSLFGHVRGAFTGALDRRQGLLKAADKGVLFLDEIGELGLDEQAMCLRAIEEKSFFPVGSDKPVDSNFQLLAGTNKDLDTEVKAGRFRADLLARLNLWTFKLPALADRREDIEPNLDHELEKLSRNEGRRISINTEARERYLSFANDSCATWDGNFRDLAASVSRMGTLAPKGRIDVDTVKEEIDRLRRQWAGRQETDLVDLVLGDHAAEIDLFDRATLGTVIDICRRSRSISAAGRELFAQSRKSKASSNDADRLRKYLARFGLEFEAVKKSLATL